MMRLRVRPFWISAGQVLLGAAGVVLLTFLCYRLQLNVAMAVLWDLVVVILLSLAGNFLAGGLVSFVAALSLNYFFSAPLFTLEVESTLDWVALAVFLTTALVVSRLVSSLRQALQRVQAANQELGAVVDAIPALVVTTLPDGTLDFINRRCVEFTGLSLTDAVRPETPAVHPDDLPELVTHWQAAVGTGQAFETEIRIRRADGEYRWMLVRALPRRDVLGTIVKWYATGTDIEDRKRAKEELHRSEAYLAEAQRLSHTGSWARNLRQPEESYWSAEAYRIFGVDPAGDPATVIQEMRDRVHPDDWPRLQEAGARAIRDRTDFAVNYRAVLPTGSIRFIHAVGHPVTDSTGQVVALVGTVIDVTERKRTERALRRARERTLQARFAAVLNERTRLAREIHDTLLQGFTGVALKLLAASNRVTEPRESVIALREVVALAQKTLTDARRAVWDLRAPSPPGGNFPAAIRTAAQDCVRDTGLALEYDVSGTMQPVDPEIEAVALRVVQESITNVVKHAAARSVRVHLSFEPRRMQLAVADDGRGFIVDPDFGTYGGHWGLLGMRERTSQVRGKLSVRSAPGEGTEIVLLLPYLAPREPTADFRSGEPTADPVDRLEPSPLQGASRPA